MAGLKRLPEGAQTLNFSAYISEQKLHYAWPKQQETGVFTTTKCWNQKKKF